MPCKCTGSVEAVWLSNKLVYPRDIPEARVLIVKDGKIVLLKEVFK